MEKPVSYVWMGVENEKRSLEPLCESETTLQDWNVTPPITFWFVDDTFKS